MDRQKVALVTGVSSGIGLATATAFADAGFRTFGTFRNPAKSGKCGAGPSGRSRRKLGALGCGESARKRGQA